MTGLSMGIEGWLLMAGWAAVMVLVVWLLVREPHHDAVSQDAAAILRRRFARGEITEEEYRRAASIVDVDADLAPAAGEHAARHSHAGQEANDD